MLLGPVDPEPVDRRPGAEHQEVVAEAVAVGQVDLAAVPVDADDGRPAEAHVVLSLEQRTDGVADVDAAQPGGGHLVQERLEHVEVVAVNHGDVDLGAGQAAGGRQTAEAGSHHDHVRPGGSRARPATVAHSATDGHRRSVRPAWAPGRHAIAWSSDDPSQRVPFADISTHLFPSGVSDEQVLMLADILPTGYEVGVLNGEARSGRALEPRRHRHHGAA
jgi:hypothetical protein